VNLSRAPDGQWYKFIGVPLGNRTAKYPKGDVIGVLTRWKPAQKLLTWQHVETILNRIGEGDPNGMFFTSARQGKEYWAGTIIMSVAGFTETQAAKKLKEWLDCGLLSRGNHKSPKTKKDVEKLLVDPIQRAYLIGQLSDAV
jgi:hypothetical protein